MRRLLKPNRASARLLQASKGSIKIKNLNWIIVSIGVADEYISVVEVMQYRSDMDCFIPLMEKFKKLYGFYPKYPVADARYGSFNNYIFCQMHGMEKFMKFPMYEKE